MSLLSLTVKKARFVGTHASQWSSYATLKLQSVKSTTIVVKGANPSWEQDFLFELNNLDVGLLIEVWNKGRFWDNVIGYHYLLLTDIHCSNVAGAGQWLSLDAELVMRDGEVVETKSPTGHVLLVDARFELPLGDMEGDEAVELQWKLEMLNSMLDQEARAEQSRRQQQYYIQSGVSEDSDYTSDVNYPVGQHPNSSASQYLSAEFSLNSSRENSYEKEEEQRSKGTTYPTSPRVQGTRLLPQIHAPNQFGTTDPRNYETDPLYYNSRPQPHKPHYRSNYRTDSFENSYNYGAQDEDYDDYEDGEEYPNPSFHQIPPRRKALRRKGSSIERQETLYGDEDYLDEFSTKETIGTEPNQIQVPTYGPATSAADQYSGPGPPGRRLQPQIRNRIRYDSSVNGDAYYGSPYSNQYNSTNYADEKYDASVPVDYVDNTNQNSLGIGSQKSYSYQDWYSGDSRDHYTQPSCPTDYKNQHPLPVSQNQPSTSKSSFQQQFGLTNLKKTIASVFPGISTPTQPDPTMSKTLATTSNSQQEPVYSNTVASMPYAEHLSNSYPYANSDQVVPQTTTYDSTGLFQDERFDYENWDFTNGYYDESGNFVPYQGYYDESGNFVPTETEITNDGYYGSQGGVEDLAQPTYDNTSFYSSGSKEAPVTGGTQPHPQYSEEDYSYHAGQNYDPYYYDEETDYAIPPSTDPAYKKDITGQTNIQSQPSVEYNYAYQSSENLASSSEKPSKLDAVLQRASSVIKRRSFRRQTSTLDYGLDGGPPDSKEPTRTVSQAHPPQPMTKGTADSQSLSVDETHYDDAWTSQEYMDATGDSYDHYTDALEEHDDERTTGDGPVHMDSVESNSSGHGGQDPDANEKFEAQYWQRQRERIAEHAALHSQESQEYYGYESFDAPDDQIHPQHPPRLESIEESPFTPPPTIIGGVPEKIGIQRQESDADWINGGQNSGRNSLDQPMDWVSRHGSIKLKKGMSRELSRQETVEGQPDVADEEYLGEYEEDEFGHPFMRKHSSISVDSEGETLPPTSPPPEEDLLPKSQQSLDEESVPLRKESIELPGNEKPLKSVSFEEEIPTVMIPERHTKGMSSKEKWLWSMNRICTTLQVYHASRPVSFPLV